MLRSVTKTLVFALVLGLAKASCPNQCTGNGKCGAEDICTCFPRWTGPDCSVRECPYGPSWVAELSSDAHIGPATGVLGGRHGYTMCSSKGACSQETGECECFQGFTGLACSRQACSEGCSGHGRCITNKQANSQYAYKNSFVSQFWDASMTRMCACDRGWQGYACQDRICPTGADPLTCHRQKNDPTVQRVSLKNMDFPFHKTDSFKIAITLTFTDMFGGRYTTQPIRLKGKSRGLKDEATYNSNTYTLRPCAQPDVLNPVTSSSDPATGIDFTKCSQEGAWTTLNQFDNVNGEPYVPNAGVALEDFDANRIRHALQSLPNFAVPSVNVTDVYPIDGDSIGVSDLRYNSRWYFDVTFSHPATSGEQALMECTIASPATDSPASAPRMNAPSIWEHTADVSECLICDGVMSYEVDRLRNGGLCMGTTSDDGVTWDTLTDDAHCDGSCKWVEDLADPNGGSCLPISQSCLRNDGYGNYVCDGAAPGVTASFSTCDGSVAVFVPYPIKGCPAAREDLIQGVALAVMPGDEAVWTASLARFNALEFHSSCTGGTRLHKACADQTLVSDCDGQCIWDIHSGSGYSCSGGVVRADASSCTNGNPALNTYTQCTGSCIWKEGRVLVQSKHLNGDSWWLSPLDMRPSLDGSDTTCNANTKDECGDGCYWIVADAGGWTSAAVGETVTKNARSNGVCVGEWSGAARADPANNAGHLELARDAPTCTVSRVAVPNPASRHICSNRGLCDKGTGLCICFEGFVSEDCSRQNIYF